LHSSLHPNVTYPLSLHDALPIWESNLTDLFTTKPKPPLAELLRPKTLDEFVGQRHLLGPGKPLRLAFEAGKLHSFILWGPPGVRSEEHTSELQSREKLVCRLLLE